MNKIILYKHFWFFLCIVLSIGFAGCKNQQKLAEEQAARVKVENTAKAKALLLEILNDEGEMTLAEKERKLRQAKTLNSDDPEVLQLIAQVEELLEQEREAQSAPPEPVAVEDPSLEDDLGDLFGRIAGSAGSASVNNLIDEGLNMFSSPDAPVLIIISQSGDIKDYDEPTTIERYLNYLKDHKVSPNEVYHLEKDGYGKISELELIKKSNR